MVDVYNDVITENNKFDEKTLKYEVLREICSMTSVDINKKIDDYIDDITSGKLDDVDIEIVKAKAKICAECLLKRDIKVATI